MDFRLNLLMAQSPNPLDLEAVVGNHEPTQSRIQVGAWLGSPVCCLVGSANTPRGCSSDRDIYRNGYDASRASPETNDWFMA